MKRYKKFLENGNMQNKTMYIDVDKIPLTMNVDGEVYEIRIDCDDILRKRIFFTRMQDPNQEYDYFDKGCDYINFMTFSWERYKWVFTNHNTKGRNISEGCNIITDDLSIEHINRAYNIIQKVCYTENEIAETVEEDVSRWELMDV